MQRVHFVHELLNAWRHRGTAEQHTERKHSQRSHAGQITPWHLHSWVGNVLAGKIDRFDADIEPARERQDAKKLHHTTTKPLAPTFFFIEQCILIKVKRWDCSEDVDQQETNRNHRHDHDHVPKGTTARNLQSQRCDVEEYPVENLVILRTVL